MGIDQKQAELEKLAQRILDDEVCPELAEGATQLVFGDGNPGAEVVFIGEAPGKREDETGKPFVGAAGKFLDEMLGLINLDRDDIYITNIVKYRPPNNRDPLPEEKKAFLPYLQSQLEIIQPKVVVTLGRHSTNCFLPGLQISKCHGQPKRIKIAFSKRTSGGNGSSAMQGAGEARTETVLKYGGARSRTVELQASLQSQRAAREEVQPIGALESATPQRAEKSGRVSGSADKQDGLAIVLLPLYHPAAALYNGSQRQMLIDDFMNTPIILDKLNSSKLKEATNA